MTLYRKEIIERCRFPRHRGEIKNPDLQGEVMNDLCGDEITLFLKFDPVRDVCTNRLKSPYSKTEFAKVGVTTGNQISNGVDAGKKKVVEAKFSGEGCALMTASADILCSALLGKDKKDLGKFSEEDLLSLYGEKPTPARTRCVLLPLEALRSGLKMLF